MVEASIAKTGLSMESSRSFSATYNCFASFINTQAKSENILQSLFSFAVDKVLTPENYDPKEYYLVSLFGRMNLDLGGLNFFKTF